MKKAENKVAALDKEKELMTALYEKAKELVIKHNRASTIFIQKKLLINHWRASRLMDELRINGIV